jgi:hypothetical protein
LSGVWGLFPGRTAGQIGITRSKAICYLRFAESTRAILQNFRAGTMAASASPSPQTTLLATLVDQARRAGRTSRYLAAYAAAARAAAAEAVERALSHRREREAWAEILDRIPADPDHLLILCAYCHRARGENGWTVLPTGVEMELHAWPGVLLSHGLCPDCLRLQQLEYTPALSA